MLEVKGRWSRGLQPGGVGSLWKLRRTPTREAAGTQFDVQGAEGAGTLAPEPLAKSWPADT